MSAFEDEFEIPAASEIDPAAEFLAKEQVNDFVEFGLKELYQRIFQEELGDIGEDLGLGAPAQDIPTFDNDNVAIKNDDDEVSCSTIFIA